MPNSNLIACSGLEHLLSSTGERIANADAGVSLALRRDISLATIMARKGAHHALAERVQKAFGLMLPEPSKRVSDGSVAFAWAAPDQWLAMAESADRAVFEARLRTELADTASISNQSDGRTIIRAGGPWMRDALAKGFPLDLHPTVFKTGSTAVTTVAHIGVHFWQLDDTPTYEFAIFRSFAVAFWEFLVVSSAEYGVNIVFD